ncbi:MAG: hypothetical protein ACI4S0_12505 [Dorea sp.]
MAVFKVMRNHRQDADFMKNTIQSLWNNPCTIAKFSPNVLGTSSESICNLFSMTQSAWGKYPLVKIHCFMLDFGEIRDEAKITGLIYRVLQYFMAEYQIICTLYTNRQGNYEAAFIINAVSYRTGRCFHDNNQTYHDLLPQLRDMSQIDWRITADDGLFFKNNGSHQECYKN